MNDIEKNGRLRAIQELMAQHVGPAMDNRLRGAMAPPPADDTGQGADPSGGAPDDNEAQELAAILQLLESSSKKKEPATPVGQ